MTRRTKKARPGMLAEETDRAYDARMAGEVPFRGRYVTRRVVFERIRDSPEWAGAQVIETEHAWVMRRESALCRIWKSDPAKLAVSVTHGHR